MRCNHRQCYAILCDWGITLYDSKLVTSLAGYLGDSGIAHGLKLTSEDSSRSIPKWVQIGLLNV